MRNEGLSLTLLSSYGHFHSLGNPSGFVDGPAVVVDCLFLGTGL